MTTEGEIARAAVRAITGVVESFERVCRDLMLTNRELCQVLGEKNLTLPQAPPPVYTAEFHKPPIIPPDLAVSLDPSVSPPDETHPFSETGYSNDVLAAVLGAPPGGYQVIPPPDKDESE